MIEKNNHYYLLIKNATGKDKINLINKEIERCYEILTYIIKTSKLNTEKSSEQQIKQGIQEFLNYLDELEYITNEEEKRKSLFNETKVYIIMLQLLANNL